MAELHYQASSSGGHWVFGLSWFAVVGSHGTAMARARAKQMRANGLVVGGGRALMAGCGRLKRHGVLHSAAQQVASFCAPHSLAVVVTLADQVHCLLAVQDGVVIQDQIFARAEPAQAALEQLVRTPGASYALDPQTAQAALAAPALPQASLQRLRPWRRFIVLFIGLSLTAAAALVLLRPGAAPAAQAAAAVPAPPPLLCLPAVIDSLLRLPLRPAGWQLQDGRCSPQAESWFCQARYDPRDIASVHGLPVDTGLPSGWVWSQSGFDELTLDWTADGLCTGLPAQGLRQHWMQALQPWRGIFSQRWLGPAEGNVSRLSLSGPLRSFLLPAWSTLGASWTSLHLQFDPSQTTGRDQSALSLQLSGEIHDSLP